MKDEYIQQAFDRYEALIGTAINAKQQVFWRKWLQSQYALDAHVKVMHAIDTIAAEYVKVGKFAKHPGLAHVKSAYADLSKSKRHVVAKLSQCEICASQGTLYVVTALDTKKSRQRLVPRFTIIPSPVAYVRSIPCTCDLGNSINSARQKPYSPTELKTLHQKYAYPWACTLDKSKSSATHANEWRASCEGYWRNGDRDQTRGHDAQGKPVYGFTTEPQRNYKPKG